MDKESTHFLIETRDYFLDVMSDLKKVDLRPGFRLLLDPSNIERHVYVEEHRVVSAPEYLMRKTLIYLTIIVLSSIAALVVAEAAYRMRLVKLVAEPTPAAEIAFNLNDQSPWEFREKFGYI